MSVTEQNNPAAPTDRPNPGALFAESVAAEAGKRSRSRNVGALGRLGPYLAARKSDLALAGLFLLLSSLATLTLPLAARQVIDHGLAGGDVAAADRYFVLLGIAAAALAVFSAARYYYVSKIGERVVADLRADVYDRVIGLSPSFFARISTGETLSRLTADAQVIETLVGSSASMALRSAITATGALALMIYTSWKLTALLLLVVPFAMLFLFSLGRQVRRLSATAQDRLADASGAAAEAIESIETVQAFSREDSARRTYRSAIDAAFEATRKRILARSWLTAGIILLMFGGVAGVLWAGARSVIAGDMTGGALAQFVIFAVLAAGSGATVAETWGDVQKAAGATERLGALLDETPDISAPASPRAMAEPARGEVVLERVSFAYPGADGRSSLKDFSLRAAPGETVAIVGPSGAGKSTVFKLLLRLYDPETGAVRLDGVDAREADPVEWRRRFAYVAQDAALFSGSARDNIAFGRDGVTDAEIRAAAQAAEAEAFVAARSGGFEAFLGARARQLSGGERQRLALARALVRNAPVLLLDEATSALDAENERLVQKAIEAARAGRTTLVIAHRLATVVRADRIVVMDQGRIVEEGRHAELLARGGLYARLAALQFDAAA